MIIRMARKSFKIRRKRMMLAILSVTMGALLIASMLNIYRNIEEEMSKQLKAYGPNIIVVPKGSALRLEVGGIPLKPPDASSYLDEGDLFKIKKVFWKYNIADFAPVLNAFADINDEKVPIIGTYFNKTIDVPGEAFKSVTTGIKNLYPWLEVEGKWTSDDDLSSAMIGREIAGKYNLNVGDSITINYENKPFTFVLSGIIRGGFTEENTIYIPLGKAQQIIGKPGAVSKIEVSSYIVPDDALAKKDRSELTQDEFIKWYCTPYIDAIAYQLEEVIDNGDAVPIAQIASAQGNLLKKITMMMLFLTSLTLFISALGVAATMTASVFERRKEIGIMMGVGANSRQIITIFAIEMMFVALIGGAMGYVIGLGLSYVISNVVFNVSFTFDISLLPITLASAMLITFIGSFVPVRSAVKINPVVMLRGE